MALFNPANLAKFTKQLNEKAGKKTRVFEARGLEENQTVDIRLQKPRPNQGGEWDYAVPVTTYWIKNKPYISIDCLGKPCPIAEEIEAAINSGDKTLAKMLESSGKKGSLYSVKTEYMMPCKIVTVEYTEDGEVKSLHIDPKQDIFRCGISLTKSINDIILNPKNNVKKNGNSIFDREKGNCITISKQGQGIDTLYKAQIDPTPLRMPAEKFDGEAVADVIGYLTKITKSEEFLRCAIRNYLYGEELPEKDIWKEELEEEEEEVVEQPKSRLKSNIEKALAPKTVATNKTSTSSLLDDLENIEDEE
jgi:hypothetical protein